MAITAAMVKELREMTGAGMMDCKKALTECGGDMEAAVDFLRKNGQAKAEKKAGRIAAEGLCAIVKEDDHTAAVVEVNSETDFVAKNADFQAYVKSVATQAVKSESKDMDAFLSEPWAEKPEVTVKDALVEKVAVIGENLSIRRFEKVVEEDGFVATYVHGGGRIGVIVDVVTDVVNDDIRDAMNNVAMQIAALRPKFVTASEISEEHRQHEIEILKEQIANDPAFAGKPEKVINGTIMGRLNKEFKEICLMDQIYVKAEDGKQTVSQYIAQVAKANSAKLSVKRFVRFETGEGIEKKKDDFAAEVMAQAGMQ